MSILCVLACVYWSQSNSSKSRVRLDSDLDDEGQPIRKGGRSPSHQRTQSMNETYINSGSSNSNQFLIQRKVDRSSIGENGVH